MEPINLQLSCYKVTKVPPSFHTVMYVTFDNSLNVGTVDQSSPLMSFDSPYIASTV